MSNSSSIGIVAIGRNEDRRLKRCLRSIIGHVQHVVYVDSGSTDGSVEFALSMGVHVVELNQDKPFTAARARNAGFCKLVEVDPDLELVMFVDGDCEVVDGFIEQAATWLTNHPEYALVSGQRIELNPELSLYNRMCGLEWDTPIGEATACGGDFLVRTGVFQNIGMFNYQLIAGEEPELCVRLRKAGGRIYRLDVPMTLHDASMNSFTQWWKRAKRTGHAYAEGWSLHGEKPWRHNAQPVRSILVWGLIFPAILLGFLIAALWIPVLALGSITLMLIHIIQWYRMVKRYRSQSRSTADSRLLTTFIMLAKYPQFAGMMSYWAGRVAGTPRKIMEYK